jgi:hypothetical protein
MLATNFTFVVNLLSPELCKISRQQFSVFRSPLYRRVSATH